MQINRAPAVELSYIPNGTGVWQLVWQLFGGWLPQNGTLRLNIVWHATISQRGEFPSGNGKPRIYWRRILKCCDLFLQGSHLFKAHMFSNELARLLRASVPKPTMRAKEIGDPPTMKHTQSSSGPELAYLIYAQMHLRKPRHDSRASSCPIRYASYRCLWTKHSPGENKMWENQLSKHQIRGWRAVSAAG